MVYGQGRGFGFRGSSPGWPYIGRGRGGLPRCAQPGLYRGVPAGTAPYSTPAYDELSALRSQADLMKRDMTEIERRIQELEKKEQ